MRKKKLKFSNAHLCDVQKKSTEKNQREQEEEIKRNESDFKERLHSDRAAATN